MGGCFGVLFGGMDVEDDRVNKFNMNKQIVKSE